MKASIISFRYWKIVFEVVYCTLVAGAIMAVFPNWGYDDPYITYRYADNLIHGLGFVYNPGIRTLSTTTPLFTLILSLLGIWQIDLPLIANVIGAISLALGSLFLWDLANTWKFPQVGWITLTLYPTFPLLVSTLSSETLLYLAFCLGSFAYYARQKYSFAATMAALAFLTRPDGALVALVLAGDYLIGKYVKSHKTPASSIETETTGKVDINNFPWKAILVYFSLVLPWIVFAWIYFGSPIPQTLFAKQHQGSLVYSERFSEGLLTIASGYAQFWEYRLEALLSLIGLLVVLLVARRWLLFIAWVLLYFIAYSILGVSRYFWYYAPLVPGFIVLVGLGMTCFKIPGLRIRRKFLWLIPLGLGVILVSRQLQHLNLLRQHFDQRLVIYPAIGEWLNENTQPEDRVGSLEVGIIGYHARRPMIDFAGIIQPDITTQLTAENGYEGAAAWAAEKYQPEYLVLQDGFSKTLINGYVKKYCHKIKQFLGHDYQYPVDFVIYRCVK